MLIISQRETEGYALCPKKMDSSETFLVTIKVLTNFLFDRAGSRCVVSDGTLGQDR